MKHQRPNTEGPPSKLEPRTSDVESPLIGSLNEKPLHAALKEWYAQPGDHTEVPLEGYVIDIVRNDLLIEIQTGNFANIKAKIADLVERHRIRLVCPIAKERWLLKLPRDGRGRPIRRRSPKRGSVLDVFHELVSLASLVPQPNFSVEVLLIQEEEVRRFDAQRAWRRRGWVTHERRLLEVLDRRLLASADDYLALVPANLTEPWTTASLATVLGTPRRLAQRMAYCLRKMGAIVPVGKQGNAILYSREGE